MADSERLESVYLALRRRLLAACKSQGFWSGDLSRSPLSTASAISALALAERHIDNDSRASGSADGMWLSGVLMRTELNELVSQSLCWLAARQNDDGGWGDSEGGVSNLAATLLVEAAFRLTGVPARYASVLERAQVYVESVGGVESLRKRGQRDKTMTAAVLANCALADLIGWRKTLSVSPESFLLPLRVRRHLVEMGACWADAARAAIGQARLVHAPPKNPLTRVLRRWACRRSLRIVGQLQGSQGGFLESPPLTSFLVMNLASVGLFDHAIVRRGIEFLLSTIGRDGSWSIGARQSVWDTSQAAAALDWNLDPDSSAPSARSEERRPAARAEATLNWLLARQSAEVDPATQTPAGGWARHGHASGLTSSDASASALLALAAWRRRWPDVRRDEVRRVALRGCVWLLDLQNSDGGWATFAKGAGRASASVSGADVTSAALRALAVWRRELQLARANPRLETRMTSALRAGVSFLTAKQSPEGDWEPLWYVDSHCPDGPNRVLGTCQALLALEELGLSQTESARRGAVWLAGVQHAAGGWGPVASPAVVRRTRAARGAPRHEAVSCSVEETASAVEALVAHADATPQVASAVEAGVEWLCEAVHAEETLAAAPVGVDFARFAFADALAPLLLATRALSRVRRQVLQRSRAVPLTI